MFGANNRSEHFFYNTVHIYYCVLVLALSQFLSGW